MGLSALTVPAGVAGAVAAIFDGGEFRQREAEELRDLVAALPSVPVVALLEFPRIEDYRRALDCGARAILSKPLLVDDLYWQLDKFHAESVPERSPG
jgi:DNA-binding NarL/FixJ family response regulator